MLQAALVDLWPLAAALVITCGAIATLCRIAAKSRVQSPKSKVNNKLHRLWTLDLGPWTRRLHRNERGSVQSLSFVLTVPFFIMLMLLAVQITQLMIGQIVVHYAAFAAARSASVWIPAEMNDLYESQNFVGVPRLPVVNESEVQRYPVLPGSSKFEMIRRAAVLACVPIAPSRDLGMADLGDKTSQALVSVASAYSQTAPANARLPMRIANKVAYAKAFTFIQIDGCHRRFGPGYQDEPPLQYFPDYEIGWRDEITVKVTHNFALLPGPGRLLARRANESQRPDTVSGSIIQSGGVYYYPLSASATLVAEGEKSVFPFVNVP